MQKEIQKAAVAFYVDRLAHANTVKQREFYAAVITKLLKNI